MDHKGGGGGYSLLKKVQPLVHIPGFKKILPIHDNKKYNA